jgi:hypothetical protein
MRTNQITEQMAPDGADRDFPPWVSQYREGRFGAGPETIANRREYVSLRPYTLRTPFPKEWKVEGSTIFLASQCPAVNKRRLNKKYMWFRINFDIPHGRQMLVQYCPASPRGIHGVTRYSPSLRYKDTVYKVLACWSMLSSESHKRCWMV